MKKGLVSLLTIFIIISICSYSAVKLFTQKDYKKKSNTIVASFYPEYIILLNLLDNCHDIDIKNMTSQATGCLHDYQLTSADMKTLDNADGFIINGGGMEVFLDDIKDSYPSLKIVDSSQGIELISNTINHTHGEHSHEHEESDEEDEHSHDHGEYNAHIWLDPSNYIIQIKNIGRALCDIYPQQESTIKKNQDNYLKKIESLSTTIDALNKKLSQNEKKDIIIFHDSFAYIANSFNFNIVKCVEVSSETSLSAKTIADTIDEINYHKIEILLSEKQFKTSIANSISKETSAKVYTLDSLVTGNNTKDSYINGMNKNISSIKKILE